MAHVVNFEFSVPNPEEAVEFYAKVFGWSIQKLPDPVRYWQVQTTGEPNQARIGGGILQSSTGSSIAKVTIEVESLDEVCSRVTAYGGSLMTEKQFVPGYGVHIICKDPQGIFFALIEPA